MEFDFDGEVAYGACAVVLRRHADRRFWIVTPYGDNSAGAYCEGLWPMVRTVMDDFGTLQAVPA